MSRERLPRAEDDLWSRHPERIVKALQTGELDYHEYAVLSFLVDLIAIPGRNGEAIFTLGRLDEALGWPLGNEWLRQKLQDLRRKGWIDYAEPRRGPGAAWVFRLSGGAIDAKRGESPGEFPTSFQLERPLSWKLIPTRRESRKPQTRNQTAFPRLTNFQLRNPLEQSRAKQRLSVKGTTTRM
jgi:hypothetical protein